MDHRLIAALKIMCAEYDLDNIKGPKWVSPSKGEIYQELINEDFLPDGPRRPIKKSIENYTVETFKGDDIRAIRTSADINVPDDWLDPKKNVGREFDYKYHYSHKHHKDLIPAMINGGEVTMPVLVKDPEDFYNAISGRHRITYAFHLDIPLEAVVLSKDFSKLYYDDYDWPKD